MNSDTIAVADRVIAHPVRPRLARVEASLIGVSMTKAKRKYTIRNPEAFAASRRKAVETTAARWAHPDDRFWSKVDKSGDCWLWTASLHRGYGVFDSRAAHRAAYRLTHGSIPDGLHVLHACDNPRCVRPDHLFLGTHRDNMADMVVKGRSPNNTGAAHPRAKLSEREVRDILNSSSTAIELARQYHVALGHIYNIRLGKAWKHLPRVRA